ncbi:MAG: hypothetical protein ACR2GF_02470 [Acidimicrobiales bacterium]
MEARASDVGRDPVNRPMFLPAAAVLAVFGAVLVGVVPEVASVLPWGNRPEPNAAQLAATTVGILMLTGAGLWWVARSMTASPAWLALTVAYNSGIVVVKFILSPAAYRSITETSLAQYVWVGVGVMVLYAAGLMAVYLVAMRNRAPREWSRASKLGLIVGLLAFAMASRFLASLALERAAADYLGHVFSGAGLWLPALIVVVSLLAVEAFDVAAHPGPGGDGAAGLQASLVTGLGLIAVYHALWALYMVRLFS